MLIGIRFCHERKYEQFIIRCFGLRKGCLWIKKGRMGYEILVAIQIERIKPTNRKVNLKISDFTL